MTDGDMRAALDEHWAASNSADFEKEHAIYAEDAVLDYPQSRERIVGRRNIRISRSLQPNKKRFVISRILGSGNLWVTEYVLAYDGAPFYTVSVMEFIEGKVTHETQYFGAPFEAGESRRKYVESMDGAGHQRGDADTRPVAFSPGMGRTGDGR